MVPPCWVKAQAQYPECPGFPLIGIVAAGCPLVCRRAADVGKAKASVAAERIMQRVRGVRVTPHFCRIEDKDPSFYREFNIIVLGLDSLEARSYINSIVCSFLGRPLRCRRTGWLGTGTSSGVGCLQDLLSIR